MTPIILAKDGKGVTSYVPCADSQYTHTLEPDEGILLAHSDLLHASPLDSLVYASTCLQADESL